MGFVPKGELDGDVPLAGHGEQVKHGGTSEHDDEAVDQQTQVEVAGQAEKGQQE